MGVVLTSDRQSDGSSAAGRRPGTTSTSDRLDGGPVPVWRRAEVPNDGPEELERRDRERESIRKNGL